MEGEEAGRGNGGKRDGEGRKEAVEEKANDADDESDDSPLPSRTLAELFSKLRTESSSPNGVVASPSTPPRKESVRSLGALVNDVVDRWNEASLPFCPSSFHVCSSCVFVCRGRGHPRWLPIGDLPHRKATWATGNFNVTQLVTNEDQSIIVRLDNGCCWLCVGTLSSPSWMVLRYDVHEAAVVDRDAWMIVDGGVHLSMQLPSDGVTHFMECEWPLRCLSVSSDCAWAIRSDDDSLVVRVGFTANRRFGTDWINQSVDGPSSLLSLCLFGGFGWLVGVNGRVWVVDGVDGSHPLGRHCWEVFRGEPMGQPKVVDIKVSPAGVFLLAGSKVFYCGGPISAHRFVSVVPPRLSVLDNFAFFSAGGWRGTNDPLDGVVVALAGSHELMVFHPEKKNLYTLPIEGIANKKVQSISSNPSYVAVVFDNGKGSLFDRRTGSSQPLSVPGGISSISLSSSSMWTCSPSGSIRISPIESPSFSSVDGKACKVCSSPSGHYVWALEDGRAFVREGAEHGKGNHWKMVDSEMEFVDVAVGDSVVWFCSRDGLVVRRIGISRGCPSGTGWDRYATGYRAVSTTADGRLFLLTSSGRLFGHQYVVCRFG